MINNFNNPNKEEDFFRIQNLFIHPVCFCANLRNLRSDPLSTFILQAY